MRLKVLAAALLVVCAFPAATAHAPSTADAATLDDASLAQQNATATEETTAADAGGSGSDSESADSDSEKAASDYTKLYVESDYDYPDLKPGESTEFTVTVANREGEDVTLDPHLYVPPVGENLIDESWVSIEGDETVAAGGEQEFTVSVSVPDDADLGRYSGQIAFTNETVAYPGQPARPVHATSVNVRVWKEPTVHIVTNTYLNGQVEAGDTTTKQIVVENTGDEAVPLNPQLKDDRTTCYGNCPSTVDPSWVDIDAPSSVGAGETATVTVTVSPPEDTESARYRGDLDLGLKDPARDDTNSYWQEISMNFEVWNQPAQAFETDFQVSESAENVTLTLSPRSSAYGQSNADPASFDVELVKPDGTTVSPERVQMRDGGSVSLSDSSNSNVEQQGEYSVRSGGQEYVYRVDDPEAGSWSLRVMPENVIGFSYDIVRNESAE